MDAGTGLLLLIIGIIAGGYGTIVGAGGGFIFVPALLIFFHMDPATAAGTGLVIVLINSLSGVQGYARDRRIDYRKGWTIGISALPGAVAGVWLLQHFASQYFHVIFATVLIALGIFLFTKNRGDQAARQTTDSVSTGPSDFWFIPLGLMMGVLSSYLGIGGGWLLVPILIYLFKTPTHYATATSLFSLSLYSSVGVVTQIAYGNMDWMAVLWGGSGVILGAQLGVLLARRLPGKVIVQMLSILLVVIGVRLYFN